jgi:hypothetical protein
MRWALTSVAQPWFASCAESGDTHPGTGESTPWDPDRLTVGHGSDDADVTTPDS